MKVNFEDKINSLDRKENDTTLNIRIYCDGDSYCAVFEDFFKNLEQSPNGFGENYLDAIQELIADFKFNKQAYLENYE